MDKLTPEDFEKMRKLLDEQRIPTKGRIALASYDHITDTFGEERADETFDVDIGLCVIKL